MPAIICSAMEKSLNQNSSAIIISLLAQPAQCEALTEEELIIAGFLSLVVGPYKLTQGLMMIAAGIILAPIPCTVGTVSTDEVTSQNGIQTRITGFSLATRSPNIPCHYTSTSQSVIHASPVIASEAKLLCNVTPVCLAPYSTRDRTWKSNFWLQSDGTTHVAWAEEGKKYNVALGCTPLEALGNQPTTVTQTRESIRTVTGYNLATTGINRVIDGAWTSVAGPLCGMVGGLCYGAKKVVTACQSIDNIPEQNAEHNHAP